MSVQAITWALKTPVKSATHKAVLIVVANYADEHGYCWPSHKKVAAQAQCSVSTVQRTLRDMEKASVLRREESRRNDGSFTTDRIFLAMDEPPQVNLTDGQSDRRSTSRTADTRSPPVNLTGLTTFEPTIEPSSAVAVAAVVSKAMIEEAQARAGMACNLTSGHVHHGGVLRQLLGGGCGWQDILDAIDNVSASMRARGRTFSSWAIVRESAIENRDRRLAGLPPSQPAKANAARPARADVAAVLDRMQAEGKIP